MENTSTEDINTVAEDKEIKKVTVTELSDGVKYSIIDEEINPEIIIGDNYYDTQLTDINLNFDKYEGKTIEIEGLYFYNDPYTFVGRYSTSNMCPNCPTGYAYFEYEWRGDKEILAEVEESWIKVKGTLKRGNDGEEYYYIDVVEIEVMKQKGKEIVSN